MHRQFQAFLRSESGSTATEYALLAALIAAVVAGAIGIIGARANALYVSAAQVLN